jgi:hypothetical protein
MWCAVQLVRKLRVRQEVLGSKLMHCKTGLPGFKLFFLVPRMGFSPGCMTPAFSPGSAIPVAKPELKPSSQSGLKPTYVLVTFSAHRPSTRTTTTTMLAFVACPCSTMTASCLPSPSSPPHPSLTYHVIIEVGLTITGK